MLKSTSTIRDPPYDFRDKGDSTLTTRFHLKTKETGYNTLAEHTRAHFNELMLLFHVTHLKQLSVRRWTMKRERANTESVLTFENET